MFNSFEFDSYVDSKDNFKRYGNEDIHRYIVNSLPKKTTNIQFDPINKKPEIFETLVRELKLSIR